MSWQATAWAVRQKTGAAARKVLLLVLANYADEHGICWPTQATLKAETELSEDTIQRHSKVLVRLGLLKMSRRRRSSGTWKVIVYHLQMQPKAMPQNAVWAKGSEHNENYPSAAVDTAPHSAASHTANTGAATPQALRHKPSLDKPSNKPSAEERRLPAEVRLQAFQRKRVGDDVIQHRIACRLGPQEQGWEILMTLSESKLQQLVVLERREALDEEMLEAVRLNHRRGAA
jgi:hypothetical protein